MPQVQTDREAREGPEAAALTAQLVLRVQNPLQGGVILAQASPMRGRKPVLSCRTGPEGAGHHPLKGLDKYSNTESTLPLPWVLSLGHTGDRSVPEC